MTLYFEYLYKRFNIGLFLTLLAASLEVLITQRYWVLVIDRSTRYQSLDHSL